MIGILKALFYTSIVASVVLLSFQSDFFKIKHIKISSQRPLSLDFIQKDLEGLKGQLIFQVSLGDLVKKINSYEFVEKALVFRKWPDRLEIKILPQNFLFYILDKKEFKFYRTSSEGKLTYVKEVQNILPIVRGESFLKDRNKRKKLMKVLSNIPEKGLFSLPEISEIYQLKSKDLVFVLVESRTRLLLLFKPLLQYEIKQVEDVLQYLKKRELKTHSVDARFSEKIVVKLDKPYLK